MKKRWNKGLCAAALAAVLLTLACPAAGALDYEDAVEGAKTVTALEERTRSFRLDYRVWSDDSLLQAAEPCKVLLLLDRSPSMAGSLEEAERAIAGFEEEMAETSPGSQVETVPFGQGEEKPDYAAALKQAEELAQGAGDRPLYLVTLTSGQWGKDSGGLEELQRLRDLGARSYTALMCRHPGEEEEAFWQSMSSLPLSTHHYVCGGEAAACLSQIRRDVASLFSAEVVQRLDPRFEIGVREQERLRETGAHVWEENGSFTVSWEADLPRRKAHPWTASLTVRARDGFPGGNGIPTDGEGTGLFRAGKLVRALPATRVNAALKLDLTGAETEIFLGEHVRTLLDGETVEERMLRGGGPTWYGKGQTGTFSYLWETEDGDPVGSLEQLGTLRPEEDTIYRLRVAFRPGSSGAGAAGRPVSETGWEASYRVKVVSGTIRVQAVPEEGVKLDSAQTLPFKLEREEGGVWFAAARLEADPQGGRLLLEGEAAALPYGTYRVTPLAAAGLRCGESEQTCRLGVWEKDDTVSALRDRALARFTLRRSGPN